MRGNWIRESPDRGVVVFVHGLATDGRACWTNKNGTYWPDLLAADTVIDGPGIYVFTYRSDAFRAGYHLADAVDALREHLWLDSVLPARHVIFVCHSMGGIVVRRLLVQRRSEFSHAGMPIGLFLLASPSLGSNYAEWFATLARVLGHPQLQTPRFSDDNTWLNDLDRDFVNLQASRRLRLLGKELIEDRLAVVPRWFWRKQIVRPVSGARHFGEPYKVANSDHGSIAKPADREDIQHRLLREFCATVASTPKPATKCEAAARVQASSTGGSPQLSLFERAARQEALVAEPKSDDAARQGTARARAGDAGRWMIPNPVIAVVAEVLGDHYDSHEKLNKIFTEGGALGEPPPGSCAEECLSWLCRVNHDSSIDPLQVLSAVLLQLMETGGGGRVHDAKREARRQDRVRGVLALHGLAYHDGEIIPVRLRGPHP
jgi:pimeloyl-ACP methyl ester carboxylesterase